MGRIRNIDIDYDAQSWGRKGVPVALKQIRGKMPIDVDAAILQVALITRPPSLSPLHLSNTWSWLRYFSAISPEARLSLDHTWDEIDPHQKTILSDDWGMGFATAIMQQVYGVWAWVPTHSLAKYAPSLFSLHRSGAKKGPAKSPDFVGLTRRGTLIVLECKGTQTSRDFSGSQVLKGSPQKLALRVSSALRVETKVVGGLFVPALHHPEDPRLYFRDPRVDQALERLGGPGLLRWIVRLQLAAQMGLVGAHLTQAAQLDDDADLRMAVREDARKLQQPVQRGWSRSGRASIDAAAEVVVVAEVSSTTVELLGKVGSADAAAAALWDTRGKIDQLRFIPESEAEIDRARYGIVESEGEDAAGLASPTGFRLNARRTTPGGRR